MNILPTREEATGTSDPVWVEPNALLREWFDWWVNSGPPRMPNALHVRTALFLQEQKLVEDIP